MIPEDNVMIPVSERKSSSSLKAFGRGFVDGVGSVGNLVVLSRPNLGTRRRVLFKASRRSWQTDKIMIHRDFQVALGKFDERPKEK